MRARKVGTISPEGGVTGAIWGGGGGGGGVALVLVTVLRSSRASCMSVP